MHKVYGESATVEPDVVKDSAPDLSFQPHYGPGVDSASNRNEYKESSWGKGWPACKADNLTAICEPIVQKMWEPRRLPTLWAFTLASGYLQCRRNGCIL
jgi:hypothetical protein